MAELQGDVPNRTKFNNWIVEIENKVKTDVEAADCRTALFRDNPELVACDCSLAALEPEHVLYSHTRRPHGDCRQRADWASEEKRP